MKAGDYVRTKNPRHVGKGEVRYYKIMEVVKVNGSCVTLKYGRKWNMSTIVKCTTTNVPNDFECQGDNYGDSDNFHHIMDIRTTTINRRYPWKEVLRYQLITVRHLMS